jgi:general secretion pathway protein K
LKSASGGAGPTVQVAYRSDNFLVQSQVRLERAALETWSLIRRDPYDQGSRTTPVWIREL